LESDSDPHLNPFDSYDLELLRLGWRGFSKESMKFFARKLKDKKFINKLNRFYSDQ